MKTEKMFPIETIGGRIQSLRHKANLSRCDLYDRVYPDSAAWSATSKDKTVYNWESGKSELNYENMIAVCRELKCSSDYLLGLDECTNKTTQFICDQTGLAESTIEMLIEIYNFECPDKLRALDYLFTNSDFYYTLLCQFYTYYNHALQYYAEKEKDRDFDYNKYRVNCDLRDAESYLEQQEYSTNKTYYRILDAIKNAAESNSVPEMDRKNLYDDDDDDL